MTNLHALLKKFNHFTDSQLKVKGITIDSRKVKDGYIFVALKGLHHDGYDFIEKAIENGAICIVSDRDFTLKNKKIEKVITPDIHNLSLQLALEIYDNPSKKLKIIGITGTNGKTTITYLLEAVFREAGFKTGIIGTIQNKIGDKVFPTENTTPFPTELQSLLFQMVCEKIDYVFMEVSSHALELGRVEGCEFAAGIFTNLTRDHLDFHITMNNYAKAKKKLFDKLSATGFAIVNYDDKHHAKMIESTKAKIIKYSHKTKASSLSDDFVYAKNIKFDKKTFTYKFTIHHKNKSFDIVSNLIGMHNVENILAVVAVSLTQKIAPEIIVKGIKNIHGVDGRFEFIREGQNFACIVDYAHTGDALERTLKTCKSLKMNKIITVFGCGGNRDRKKRPIMAKVSAKYSDFVIVTNDNPRDENPKIIWTDIESGFNEIGYANYEFIEDREKAIEKAINMANELDLVLIAGKGHETYQIIGGETRHFSDKEVAKNKIGALKEWLLL